ncbi:hypothetical protein [Sphingobacterium faecale]|uniref:Uncharacterized protein n=1 Tax=Sphingobacterium faecale TaxID=2803775 RepID=A0ABS1R8Q9_9SPHI|nr:hypothetical protein [Sphingobacterium faecale]MBL1411068.1 hypothetical protein [Sphingobacterium faecale]
MTVQNVLDAFQNRDLVYLQSKINPLGIYSGIAVEGFLDTVNRFFKKVDIESLANEHFYDPFTCGELASNEQGYAFFDEESYCNYLLVITVVDEIVTDIRTLYDKPKSNYILHSESNEDLSYEYLLQFKIYEEDKIGYDSSSVDYQIYLRERAIAAIHDRSHISALDVEFLESWYAENKYLKTSYEDEYYDEEECIPVEKYRFKDTFTEYLNVVEEYLKSAKSNNDHDILKRFYNSLDKDNEAHLDKWYNICKKEQAFKERMSYFVWPFNINDGSLYHLGLRFDSKPLENILFTTDKYNVMRYREIEYIRSLRS